MKYFGDVEIICQDKDDDNDDYQFEPIKLLKSINVIKRIPFSGNFEFISSFGKEENPGLLNPYDLAIDDKLQNVLVADYSNKRIAIFDLNGKFKFQIYTPAEPRSIFVDQKKERLIFGCQNNIIYTCTKRGYNIQKFYEIPSGGESVYGITMDPVTENIYICDPDSNKIHVTTSEGILLFTFGGSLIFNNCYSIAINSMRELVVSDTNNKRIQIFDCNGKFKKSFTCASFNANWGVDIDLTNDNILVANFCGQSAMVLDRDGKLLKECKNKDWIYYPIHIAYCSCNGYVYVCGYSSHNILIFK